MATPVNYNEDTDEIVVGFVPNRDGSDYDEDMESPSFDDLLGAMEDYYINEEQEVILKVIGRIYRGRTKISGMAAPVNFNTIYNVSKNGKPYRQQVRDVVNGTQDIQHVTAFVVKVL